MEKVDSGLLERTSVVRLAEVLAWADRREFARHGGARVRGLCGLTVRGDTK